MTELVEGPDPQVLRHALASRQLTPSGPMCWGPPQWIALHQMLRGYPDKPSPVAQTALKAYVIAMAGVIPCSVCSQHWSELAPTVKTGSRYEALKWSIDAHNTVNQRLGKPVYSYAQVIDMLNRQCPGNRYACSMMDATLSSTLAHAQQARVKTENAAIGVGVAAGVLVIVIVILAIYLARANHRSKGG